MRMRLDIRSLLRSFVVDTGADAHLTDWILSPTTSSSEERDLIDDLCEVGMIRRGRHIRTNRSSDPVTLELTAMGEPFARAAYDDDRWTECETEVLALLITEREHGATNGFTSA